MTGFEGDLAQKLAEYLKVKPRFFQGPWDKMPELVRTGKVDVVLNGYDGAVPRTSTRSTWA